VKYRYFIAYRWYGLSCGGVGNMGVTRTEPITTINDVQSIASNILPYLQKAYPDANKVIVLNWKRFEAPVKKKKQEASDEQ
jgi:hypothetical protein